MISVVIPTLGSRILDFEKLLFSIEEQTYKDIEVIVCSQDNHEAIDQSLRKLNLNVNHIKLNKKGLSFARNQALPYVNGNIVTFSDDDCWYKKDAFETINQFFIKNNSDISCYQIYDAEQNQYYKSYNGNQIDNIPFRDIFKKSSIEIFIKLENVTKEDLYFDESFGLGTNYPSGEENIFLLHLKKKKYKISYIPEVVVYHKKPSIESRLNFNTFKSKGPLFKRMFNTPLGFILLTGLFLKKFNMLEKPFYFYTSAIQELIKYKK